MGETTLDSSDDEGGEGYSEEDKKNHEELIKRVDNSSAQKSSVSVDQGPMIPALAQGTPAQNATKAKINATKPNPAAVQVQGKGSAQATAVRGHQWAQSHDNATKTASKKGDTKNATKVAKAKKLHHHKK